MKPISWTVQLGLPHRARQQIRAKLCELHGIPAGTKNENLPKEVKDAFEHVCMYRTWTFSIEELLPTGDFVVNINPPDTEPPEEG